MASPRRYKTAPLDLAPVNDPEKKCRASGSTLREELQPERGLGVAVTIFFSSTTRASTRRVARTATGTSSRRPITGARS